ncbi:MAG: hypothetical protein IJD81_06845 [Oscillospiraceae bacterium]|nr:hypothetical protein [Oscillospiraceae bacterium]
MLKIEVIRFEAEDVITASVEQKCICPTDDSAICSSSSHYGPNGEVCPGEPYTYPNGKTIYTHHCPVN